MPLEYHWRGRENSIDLCLRIDGVPLTDVQMDEITKITLSFDDLLVESTNQTGDPIRWRDTGYLTDGGEVRLFLKDENIPVGKYRVPMIVYFGGVGYVWQESCGNGLEIQVLQDTEAEAAVTTTTTV